MIHQTTRAKALRLALLSGVSFGLVGGMAAVAQDEEATGDRIEVVGSLIPRQDLTGPSPIAVYDETAIEQSGAISIGQLLREIPSVAGAGQTTSINNGGSGSQQISLRGLGSQRTLVLVNGRRVPDSSGSLVGQVDLNTIPVSLIERVEVLKGGASTTYGSDAVAGVVNIVLKESFEGVEVGYQTGLSDEGDAQRHAYDFTFGDTGDKGSFVVNFTKIEEDGITAGDRDWAAEATGILFGEVIPLGSSAPPWGRYFVEGAGASSVTLGPDYGGGDFFGFRDYSSSTDTYNFAPINNQTLPVNRWSFTAMGNYDLDVLTDVGPFVTTEAFAEVSYIDRESTVALAEVPLAPFAFFGYDAPFSADNAYNPFGQDITDWRRRLVEGGPRTDDVEVQTTRLITGLSGELTGGWLWELSYVYGDVSRTSTFFPIINLDNVAQAVGPTVMDGDGILRCDTDGDEAFTSADNGDCVPLNIFGENSITQDMLDFISVTQNERTQINSETISLDFVQPALFELPGGDAGLAFGFVHREERGEFIPDSQVAALGSAATGTPAQATEGGYALDEVFAEIRLPVIEQVEIDAGLRYSDYDTFGSTTNYKVGLQVRPVESVLLRGSFNTAFRAPQIDDLFGGQSFSFPSVTDPCASNPTASCIADGVPAGGFDQISSQVRTLVGGNPDVQPEESETLTAGFVYSGSGSLDGVAFGVDYFDYEIVDPITTVGASVILQQCATTGAFCDLIDRVTTPGATEGAPILIVNTTTNVGMIEAAGVDFFAEYTGLEDPFFGGVIDLKFDGTYYDQYDVTQADGSVVEHAGFFRDDQEGHFAHWRWTAGGSYSFGPFALSTSVRYIGGVDEFGNDLLGSCVDEVGNVATVFGVYMDGKNRGLTCVTSGSAYAESNLGDYHRKVEAATYVDLYASYDFDAFGTESQVYFGVDNVGNETPPYSVDGFNDNTDVRTYDTLGRYYYAGFRTQF